MIEIPITQGKVVIIDDEDFERVKAHHWWVHNKGYAEALINTKYVLMHRWIMGAKREQHLDHINGNKLDNRKCNLRFCTRSQNHANADKHTVNTSGFKGVSWHRQSERFRSYLKINRRQLHLGLFDDPKDAARAYDRAARKYFGEFARVNFPEEANGQHS